MLHDFKDVLDTRLRSDDHSVEVFKDSILITLPEVTVKLELIINGDWDDISTLYLGICAVNVRNKKEMSKLTSLIKDNIPEENKQYLHGKLM